MSDAFVGRGFGAFVRPDGFGVNVDVPDIPLWVPDRARGILNDLIRDTVKLALLEVAGRVGDAAQRFADTGHLAQSFQADPANATGGIELVNKDNADARDGLLGRVFSSLPYAIVMNNGRLAGRPISRAGIDAIGLWARRKLGLTAEQADHAKFAIARSIIAHGIEGKDYFGEGVQAATPRVEQLFGILSDRIGRALVSAVPGAAAGGGVG